MYITPDTIIKAAAIITASATIITMLFTFFKWLKKQEKQDEDIKSLKKETEIICYGLSAVLDGLTQLNCNHTVPKAKADLEKYLNEKAHQ